jgi:hypothetical protein
VRPYPPVTGRGEPVRLAGDGRRIVCRRCIICTCAASSALALHHLHLRVPGLINYCLTGPPFASIKITHWIPTFGSGPMVNTHAKKAIYFPEAQASRSPAVDRSASGPSTFSGRLSYPLSVCCFCGSA